MVLRYNVEDEREMKKLTFSKRFTKYPDMFLTNSCEVKVNADDFLQENSFIIKCNLKILPRKIFLYGKKNRNYIDDDLFLNYWMDIFLKTVEKGYLHKYDFQKSSLKTELCIGLPLEFRRRAFDYKNWTKQSVIKFLSCLFDTTLEESEYDQQDLFDELVA